MRSAFAMLVVLTAAFVSGCDEDPRDGGAPTAAPETPESEPPETALPQLCPSCVDSSNSGGDTSDFGGGEPAPVCRGYLQSAMVGGEDLAAMGIDPRTLLAEFADTISARVRWLRMGRSSQFAVRLRPTGAAQILHWKPNSRWSSELPPCPCDARFVWPQVEVELQTDDDAVQGRFIAWAKTNGQDPRVSARLPYVELVGDGSELRGNLELKQAGQAPPSRVIVRIGVVRADGESADRIDFTLVTGPENFTVLLEAWPDDECSSPLTVPVDGECLNVFQPLAPGYRDSVPVEFDPDFDGGCLPSD